MEKYETVELWEIPDLDDDPDDLRLSVVEVWLDDADDSSRSVLESFADDLVESIMDEM